MTTEEAKLEALKKLRGFQILHGIFVCIIEAVKALILGYLSWRYILPLGAGLKIPGLSWLYSWYLSSWGFTRYYISILLISLLYNLWLSYLREAIAKSNSTN